MTTAFRLDVSFNEVTGKPVAAYLHVRKGQVAETKEVQEGVVFADYDNRGALLGLELLAPCDLEVLNDISRSEPEPVQRFLKGGAPRDLVCI